MLIANDPSLANYLGLQHLETTYGPPWGRLYLAASVLDLRKLIVYCEMKRLYVRPEFRGLHIGSRLIKQIIKDAEAIGYQHMCLETLPFLTSAVQLYKRFGFYEIESYNQSPMELSIYYFQLKTPWSIQGVMVLQT